MRNCQVENVAVTIQAREYDQDFKNGAHNRPTSDRVRSQNSSPSLEPDISSQRLHLHVTEAFL